MESAAASSDVEENKPPKKVSLNKKCDICSRIKPKGFCLSEEVFGNNMSAIIEHVSGIPVEANILTTYFACRECTISLIAAEDIAVKTRNLVKKITTAKTRRKVKPNKSIDGAEAFANQMCSIAKKKKAAPKKKASDVKQQTDASEITAYDAFFGKEPESRVIASSTMVPNAAGNVSKLLSSPVKTKTAIAENGNLANGNNGKGYYENATQPASKASKGAAAKNAKVSNKKRRISENATSEIAKKPLHEGVVSFTKFQDETDDNPSKAKPKKKAPKKSKLTAATTEIFDEENASVEHVPGDYVEFQKDCPNCGKTFYTCEKYNSHVFGQKCRNAIYECQNVYCNRRFTKESKMQDHMVKKHGGNE